MRFNSIQRACEQCSVSQQVISAVILRKAGKHI